MRVGGARSAVPSAKRESAEREARVCRARSAILTSAKRESAERAARVSRARSGWDLGARTSTTYVRARVSSLGFRKGISSPTERAARAAEGERSSDEFVVRSVENGGALKKADRACKYITSEVTIQQDG